MKRIIGLTIFLLFVVFLFVALPAWAGVGEITISNSLNADLEPAVASDGTNYLIVWYEDSGYDSNIKGALIRASDGAVLASNIVISSATGPQIRPKVSFNGTNYFVVWMDGRLFDGIGFHIYGARVRTSDGVVLDPDGFLISSTSSEQLEPALASDGTYCLVVWTDNRNYFIPGTGWDIYGARVRVSDATILEEIAISTSTYVNEGHPSVTYNGTNYLVAWGHVMLNESVLYAKRISPAGVILDLSAIIVTTNLGYIDLSAASDDTNYFVAWRQWGNQDDVYGARIDSTGTVLDPSGIAIANGVNYQREVSAMFDGINYFVVWHDFPNGGPGDIYGARISKAGNVLDPSGILLSGHSADQYEPAIAPSNINNIVVWRDDRSGNWDIYGRLLGLGTIDLPAGIVPFQTVLGPGTASWEIDGVGTPFVMKEGGTYKMWYGGFRYCTCGIYTNLIYKIGYAESNDGINWGNRQLVHSNGECCYYARDPYVIKEGSSYRLWHEDYFEWVAGDWSSYISHMTSTDGINWFNEQKVLSGGGDFIGWDGYCAGGPSVIREADGTYSMWYYVAEHHWVGEPPSGLSNIARVTSFDGISWINKQLVLPRTTTEPAPLFPDVVREADGTYTMYYSANGYIARAKSADGIFWSDREQILSWSQLGTGWLSAPHYFKDTDGTEYLYFSFWKPGSGEYIGRARLVDILAAIAPAQIVNFSASDGEDSQSTLTWTNPPDSDLAEVVVIRKTGAYPTSHTDGTLVYQNTSPTPIGSETTTDTGLANGTIYYYAVYSKDIAGHWNDITTPGLNADTGTPQADTIPPTTTLSTTPAAPDGANDWFVTTPFISISRNEPGTTYYQWDSTTGAWQTYSVPFSAPEGQHTLYYYSVDIATNTELIKSQLFKTDITPPIAPINLAATAPDPYRTNLTWNASTDNVAVSGYNVYNADTNAFLVTTPNTFYNFIGLTPNTTYRYYVKAFDLSGNLSGASNTTPVTTPSLQAPTELTATAKSAYRIDLTWKAPTPKTGLLGYKIERSPDGLTNWQVIVDVPSIDTTSYPDTGLSPSTLYYYRVRSYDSTGNTSDPTNVANATTYKVGSVSTGSNVSVDLGNGASLTFKNVAASGTVTVEVPDTPPPPDFGFSVSRDIYFDFIFNAVAYSGPVLVALPYDEIKNPRLIHYESGKWVDVTIPLKGETLPDPDFPQVTVNPDTVNKIIYGKVASLSPFAIVEPVCSNGILDTGEECDDGNLVSGDGCSPTCQKEPDISVSPTSLNFGQVVVGFTSAAQTVTITNTGAGNLKIDGITITDFSNVFQFGKQNDNCSGKTLAPSASCTLQALFSPTSLGLKNAKLRIPSNDPDENPVDVSMSGTGIAGKVTVTYPNGGETWKSGKQYTITWNTAGTAQPVALTKVYVSANGGATWKLIKTLSGNPGSYLWTVPTVGTNLTKCRIGVVLLNASVKILAKDTSDANFTVQP